MYFYTKKINVVHYLPIISLTPHSQKVFRTITSSKQYSNNELSIYITRYIFLKTGRDLAEQRLYIPKRNPHSVTLVR